MLEQNEEIEELRRDAQRYRWLRMWTVKSHLAYGRTKELDYEIDEAMQGRGVPVNKRPFKFIQKLKSKNGEE